MKCPHCRESFHSTPQKDCIFGHAGIMWWIDYEICPACNKPIITLRQTTNGDAYITESLVYPKGTNRPPCPPEVPSDIAQDYSQACLVLDDSPPASAALSRRCLQYLLSERNVSTERDLNKAIDDALASNLPTHISNDLDAIREIGNFAAHTQKHTHTGEILPVEDHEAEWNLDVLESLFDYYYVQPERSRAKRDAFNTKLSDAGRKPLKTPK